MLETRKTVIYIAAAAVLALVAYLMSPGKITSDAFLDQGEAFFPDFTDPNTATTLEVIEYDEATAAARPFKVTFQNGRWTIPSHHDYPADGKEQLAKTAAGVIDIEKGDLRSDNVADHELFGVIDPLDETAGSAGRGQRVTIKGENDQVLADLIVGKPLENREGYRFVRLPDDKRVYSCRMDIEISTRFEDWIETDLLKVRKHRIDKLVLKDYSIDERTRQVKQRDNVLLTKVDDTWRADKMSSNQRVDSTRMDTLLNTLDSLMIVGVRTKPAGLSASLKKAEGQQTISQSDLISLQSRGFFFTRDGKLLSNEGELEVYTKDGLKYILRYGEVVYGRGEAVSAGTAETQQQEGPAENRYLFITTEFDRSLLPEPKLPKDRSFLEKPDSLWTEADKENRVKQDAYNRWERKVEEGQKLSDDLNTRFADWYYVISSDSYEKLHLTRRDLVVAK